MLGEDAYSRGDTMEMNPYDERDGQHDEWDDGFSQSEISDSEYDVGN